MEGVADLVGLGQLRRVSSCVQGKGEVRCSAMQCSEMKQSRRIGTLFMADQDRLSGKLKPPPKN